MFTMTKKNLTGALTALSLTLLSLLPHQSQAADTPQLIDLGGGFSISRIHPIDLHDGINNIPHFIPNGHDGVIFQAWRDNGNQHGYTDWMIAERTAINSPHGLNLIAIHEDTVPLPRDYVYNDPYDGKHALKIVRFAQAIVNEQTMSVMIIASRDLRKKDSLEKPVPVNIAVYAMQPKKHTVGSTAFEFREIGSILTPNSYCNPTLAISQLLFLPLPANYTSDRVNGCH